MLDFEAETWWAATTAPKHGERILALIGATEQGGREIDIVRWGDCRSHGEFCWIADGSCASCAIIYCDCEIVGWMPLPESAACLGQPIVPAYAIASYGRDGAGI